jgi:hypothetical protein
LIRFAKIVKALTDKDSVGNPKRAVAPRRVQHLVLGEIDLYLTRTTESP